MAYSLPAKPTFNAVTPQRWDGWGDAIDSTMRGLIVDVPGLRTDLTAVTTRVSQVEMKASNAVSDVATTQAQLVTLSSQVDSAVTNASTAAAASSTAQAAASQAAANAQTAAGQVAGLSTTVTTAASDIAALKTGKADKSTLSTVATTGKYSDLIGAPNASTFTPDTLPAGSIISTTSTTTRPTSRTDIRVRWFTPTPPLSVWFAGLDEWVPVLAADVTTAVTDFQGGVWPSNWTIRPPVTAGGGASVVAGRGRLATGASGNYNGDDSVAARYGGPAADIDVSFLFQLVTDSPFLRYVLRCGDASLDAASSLTVLIEKGRVYAQAVSNWAGTTVGNADKVHNTGGDYRCRIKAVGTTLRVRTWPASSAEPGTWDVTANVAAATGWQGFAVGSGVAAVSQIVDVDDVTYALNPA